MKSLITGGAGFIGSHLTERLLERGDEVTLLDNLSTGRRQNIKFLLDNPKVKFIDGSVDNETLMEILIAGCDRVFHLAAAVGVALIVKEPVHTIETNIHGSQVVLDAAARHNRKIFLASTSEVYGKSTKIPFSEDDDVVYGNTTLSRWSYAASKAIDEYLALAYFNQSGLPVVIGRFFNTVGPRQTGAYGMVVPRFVESALRGQPIKVYGDGKQTRCFGDVADVVGAVIKLMEEPKAVGQVFNIGTDLDSTSVEDLAKRIIRLTGSGSTIEYVPYNKAYAPGFEDLRDRKPSLNKIRAMIGYRPTMSLDQTLGRIIEYTRQQMQAENGK